MGSSAPAHFCWLFLSSVSAEGFHQSWRLETGSSLNISLFLSAKVTRYLVRALQSQQSARRQTHTQKLPKTLFALAKLHYPNRKKEANIYILQIF